MHKPLTHAGAVAFQDMPEGRRFLVVASSDGRHWVLPKGHIEDGETPEQTTVRELREEAGVVAEIVGPLTDQRFAKSDEVVVVRYYLARAVAVTDADEQRACRWEDAEEAAALLSFPDAREALDLATRWDADGEGGP